MESRKAAAAFLFCVAALPAAVPAAHRGTIGGTVLDELSHPVPHTKVFAEVVGLLPHNVDYIGAIPWAETDANGRFAIRHLPWGKWAVVPFTPVLDTPINLPCGTRTFRGTIHAILDALAAKTGFQMGIGLVPMSLLMSPAATLTVGGSTAPARNFLRQAMDGLKGYVWLFLYEPAFRQYLLGVLPVERAEHDLSGNSH